MDRRGGIKKTKKLVFALFLEAVVGVTAIQLAAFAPISAQPLQDDGSVGIEGRVPGEPPPNAPTITVPSNGQVFTSAPITVSGLCQTGLLVEVFKNNVFAGATECLNGSYSMRIDLFSQRNDLVARQYDALNQQSPDSNRVTVTFRDTQAGSGPRLSLFSAYAKRGADSPLTWPLTISGGTPPYAVSVDWGDSGDPTLISRAAAGNFTVEHIYEQSGTYSIVFRATDANGVAAFLQVVGVKIGPTDQTTAEEASAITIRYQIPLFFWIIAALVFPLLLSAFWLGKRHEVQTLRSRIRKSEESGK